MGSFDRLTRLAARVLGVPVALITLVDSTCIIDSVPRDWTELETETVRDLAAVVSAEIERRIQRYDLDENELLLRRIVEAHGGTLSAFSEGEGHGATFTFWLPKT